MYFRRLLNKKLFTSLLITLVSLYCLIAFFVAISIFFNNTLFVFEDFIFEVLLVGTVLFTIFLISLPFTNKATRKLYHTHLSKSPLSSLEKIGFVKVENVLKSKLLYLPPHLTKLISGYTIYLDISKEDGITETSFIIDCKKKKLGLIKNSILDEELSPRNITRFRKSFYLKFSELELANLSISDLNQQLHEFVGLLKLYGFEPAEQAT